jgi:AmmeMemoRadiSam system protein B/AmmeMemoRadiSam system protein A
MFKWLLFSILFLVGGLAVVFSLNNTQDKSQKIRDCGSAGSFYPADPKELATMVDQLLVEAKKHDISGPVYALVAPHAGYVYSGHVAAHSYILLKDRDIKRVIVISPSHIESFNAAAIYDGDYYATPLGNVPIDKEFSANLAKENKYLSLSEKGHTTRRGGRTEHALEVQLPFLQRVLSDFKLVAIIMGDQSYEACRAVGTALAKLGHDNQTIIVASSDLSHFHSYDEAVTLDHKVLNAIEEWDYFNMCRNFKSRVWEACGGGPIVAAMIASERMGANKAKILKYANSGDVAYGDKSSVVGYTAVAFYKSNPEKVSVNMDFKLSKAEQKHLLNIAKTSVEKVVRDGELADCSAGDFTTLAKDRGAFVTLTKKGELRGCIGYTSPLQPLCNTVRDVAAHAAVKDPRFKPVDKSELDDLHYEISVLSPFRRVTDINQIIIGQHGLLIKKDRYEGLLLPQVATDYAWDRTTFLQQTCRKAGLPPDAWKDDKTDIFMFSAFVFGEE